MNKPGTELKDNPCESLPRMEPNLIWVPSSTSMISGKPVPSWNVRAVVFCFA